MCLCVQRLDLSSYSYEKLQKKATLTLVWAASASHPQPITQTITLFTTVVCRLFAAEQPMKWIVRTTVIFVRLLFINYYQFQFCFCSAIWIIILSFLYHDKVATWFVKLLQPPQRAVENNWVVFTSHESIPSLNCTNRGSCWFVINSSACWSCLTRWIWCLWYTGPAAASIRRIHWLTDVLCSDDWQLSFSLDCDAFLRSSLLLHFIFTSTSVTNIMPAFLSALLQVLLKMGAVSFLRLPAVSKFCGQSVEIIKILVTPSYSVSFEFWTHVNCVEPRYSLTISMETGLQGDTLNLVGEHCEWKTVLL